jgi:hypothetical protein
MEQEFVSKQRRRTLGHTRVLPRNPPPDGKRPLFPAIFPDQLGADRAQRRRRKERALPRRARACRDRRNMTERRS